MTTLRHIPTAWSCFIVCIFLFSVSTLELGATQQQLIRTYYVRDLRPADSSRSGDSIRITTRLESVIDSLRVRRPQAPDVSKCVTSIALSVNSDGAFVPSYAFSARVEGTIQGIYAFGDTRRPRRDSFRLTIDYDPLKKTYQARDAMSFEHYVYADIVCSIRYNELALNAAVPDSLFRLDVVSDADVFYKPEPTQSPTLYTIQLDTAARYLHLSWSHLPWAEYYEVEYTYVDDYSASSSAKDRSLLRFNLRRDGIRLRALQNSLDIPLVFERGYLVYRVRAVGMRGETFRTPVHGVWSLPDEGVIPEGLSVYYIGTSLMHEADRLQWTHSTDYSESGNRKDVVSYADATQRTRQRVEASPADNRVRISESFYDFKGRATITTLAAPARPLSSGLTPEPNVSVGSTTGMSPGSLRLTPGASGSVTLPSGAYGEFIRSFPYTSGSLQQRLRGSRGSGVPHVGSRGGLSAFGLNPHAVDQVEDAGTRYDLPEFLDLFRYRSAKARLGFVPDFNVNAEGRSPTRNEYDLGDTACAISALRFATTLGAANYFSADNPEQARWQAFVPSAEGFPYVQLRYAADGTGSVREATMPGAMHALGSGHSLRSFVGTPSQEELDRYFGTDVGRASFYRKTLQIDENGQGHVSIADLAGNTILNGLCGNTGANLLPLTGVEQHRVTLDLIEEQAVLNRAEWAWESTKQLVIATDNTRLTLEYQVVTPTMRALLCSGSEICFDCVYDLDIRLTDQCGAELFRYVGTIGNLADLFRCTPATIRIADSVILARGSYMISKKLRVNNDAIERRVERYRNEYLCRDTSALPIPSLEEACNPPCNTCALLNSSVVRIRRRDGSNPGIPFTKRKPGNRIGCARECVDAGLSSLGLIFQSMLNEVSPGGQYGRYLDTLLRDESNPLGMVHPVIHPLSVFNDDNQLPLRSADWRNPLYDYQTSSGDTAWIELDAAGMPEHRSPLAEIRRSEGRSYVLPKYLNHVEDFIAAWQSQWAESLVGFHPEYEHYLWSVENRTSFTFDSLMQAHDSLRQARAAGADDASRDPFYSSRPALRAERDRRLSRLYDDGSTVINAEQMAIAMVNCGNPNFSDTEFRECYGSKRLYGTPGSEDKEWVAYRGFYSSVRNAQLSAERNDAVVRRGGFDARTIGGTRDVAADPLYAGQRRLFKDADDAFAELDAEELSDSVPVAEMRNRVLAFAAARFNQRRSECALCPLALDLTAFLNALVIEKKLTQRTLVLPGISPLNLSRNIVASLRRPRSLRYEWVLRSDPNSNLLDFRFMLGTEEVGDLKLTKTKSSLKWDRIVMLDCPQSSEEFSFTLRAIGDNDSTDNIRCQSSCFRVRDCTPSPFCASTAARPEMLQLMQYLFNGGRFAQRDLVLHREGSAVSHIGSTLRMHHPRGRSWTWHFDSCSSAAKRVCFATLKIATLTEQLKPRVLECPFTVTIVEPGFTIDSVAYPIRMRRASSGPGSLDPNSSLISFRSRGGRTFEAELRSCYALYDCSSTKQGSQTAPQCCLPAPRHVPYESRCEIDLRLIAQREREREFLRLRDRLADSLGNALRSHCLMNVPETFRISYDNDMYLLTLRYYNHAGELVQSVPPLGVRPLSDEQVTRCREYRRRRLDSTLVPGHVMQTNYTHTSLGALSTKRSPDEGLSVWSYDMRGRLLLTQNAEQRTRSRIRYVLYDEYSRERESGSSDLSFEWTAFANADYVASMLRNTAETRKTSYDLPMYTFSGLNQRYLRNHRSTIRYSTDGRSDDYLAGYSYDELGNTADFIQVYRIAGLTEAQQTKKIHYEYDKLSGQITDIQYQPASFDQLYYKLIYDENNRLSLVKTSTSHLLPLLFYETDARFDYYLHGPVARMELGTERIQGLDYAYTIQGWFKGLNSYTAAAENDMGRDGLTGGELRYGMFSEDVFAEVVNYYDHDYTPISSTASRFFPDRLGSLQSEFSRSLYCGLIQSTISAAAQSSAASQSIIAQAFAYDQSKRLRETKSIIGTDARIVDSPLSEAFAQSMDYDANGNVTRLRRKAEDGSVFDDLHYHYYASPASNQLEYVSDDAAAHTESKLEIGNQASANYRYDAIGRMTTMRSEGLTAIHYSDASRVSFVEKDRAEDSVRYIYDAFGRRVAKRSHNETEWYVNAPDGSRLAQYKVKERQVHFSEASLYAGKRIGVYAPNIKDTVLDLRKNAVVRGLRSYELGNHIGDVISVVSDKKSIHRGTAVSRAEVRSTKNYFPFGYPLPGKSIGDSAYSFAFQSMESDEDFLADDLSYTTEQRQYDARLCRWLSVDPMSASLAGLSPYQAFDNNPLLLRDPRGAQSTSPEHDPAAQIAALGDVFSFPGRVASGISDAVGNWVDRARQDIHSAVTGDYTDRGRAAVLEIHPVTDAAVFWYEQASGETVTPDEVQELDRNIGNGPVTTVIEMNLREADPTLSEEAVRGLASTASSVLPVTFGTNELVDAVVDIPVEGFQETVTSVVVPRRVRREVQRSMDQIDRQLNPGEQAPTARQRRREEREAQQQRARQAVAEVERDLNTQATIQPRGERRRREQQRRETERRPRRERAQQSRAGQRPTASSRR